VKKFTIPCDFGGTKAPFNIYVGEPAADCDDPLRHQAAWLSRERGGTISEDVMDSFRKLLAIAHENDVSFEELCVYALGTTSEGESAPADESSADDNPPEASPPA
jgi:ferric-dicitrate binding protein FerR (iron transport regulator)